MKESELIAARVMHIDRIYQTSTAIRFIHRL